MSEWLKDESTMHAVIISSFVSVHFPKSSNSSVQEGPTKSKPSTKPNTAECMNLAHGSTYNSLRKIEEPACIVIYPAWFVCSSYT